jgi:hypothetical protein
MSMKRLSRRGFVLLGGAAGVAGVAAAVGYRSLSPDEAAAPATTTTTSPPAPASTRATAAPAGSRWSDPGSWSGGVPGRGQTAVVTRRIVLDVDARVGGVAIMPGGELIFDPRVSRRLESTGNVVVQGRLTMRPASAAVQHRLVFTGVSEPDFEGGGMDVLPKDTGLWVMGAGRLEVAGASKLAWTRAVGALRAGATTITLQGQLDGWRAGDELAVTPTGPPSGEGGTGDYDVVKVRAVRGRVVTLATPLAHDHPSVAVAPGRVLTAEVLNLTRNVGIEGTPAGRAHVFIRSSRPQLVKGAAIRHMGPRKQAGESSEFVTGRYGLHFHMCDDGSRESVVEGVVVRQAGSHAFVPHTSHGIAFRDCISHDTFEDAYWWDGATDTKHIGDPTDDILYEGCVASLVQHDPPFRGYRLAGFFIGRGDGNTARGCVAVGIQGSTDAAGFIWPEGSEGVWRFSDCVAHNNDQHGLFTWQNTNLVHVVSQFIGYHNAQVGISHGAYANPYVYKDSVLYGNGLAAVVVHATSSSDAPGLLTFENLVCDGARRSDYLVVSERHIPSLPVTKPTSFRRCSFTGARKAAFGWLYEGENGSSNVELFHIVDCGFAGNEFWLAPGIVAGSRITVEDPRLGSLLLRRADQQGTLVAKWNATVTRL